MKGMNIKMKIVKYTVYGALFGLCVGLVLSVFVGCNAVCSCSDDWINAFFGCNNATYASGCGGYISDPAVRSCLLYSTLICAVIGGVYGTFRTLQDKNLAQKASELEQSASAKKQRVAWASEVKQKALNVNNVCSENKTFDKPLVSTIYKSNDQMTEILNELTKISEKQGKVDFLAEELSRKDGTSI